jgi:signal transduction histidine kinase
MLGVQIFAAPPPDSEGPLVPHSLFFAITAYMAFGLAFWFNTRNIAFQSLSWRPILLLGYQAACGFVISTDLLYIVAAEIPLAVPARAASIWITVQTLLLTLWIFWLDQTGQGHLEFLPLPQLPHLVVIVLTDIGVFAIHGFAFFMGYLAASEARGRRVAERLNAELIATQDLLAQSSRIAERAYVARELHDALGHHLVALKVNLELAAHLVTESPAKAPIHDALSLVKRLLSEVREVVGLVRSQPKMELQQALMSLLSGITELSVELVFSPELKVADPVQAHVLFRCVQEAVTNTIKHSKATKLRVVFGIDRDDITLAICDDGKGATSLVPGHGLNGMRERLESAGGTLDIENATGRGLTLLARLPYPDRLPL